MGAGTRWHPETCDLGRLYQLGFDGTGQKIAVVGQTRLELSDVQGFRSFFGLSSPSVETVLTGPDPGIDANALAEAALDLEWAGAVARGAQFVYVYAIDAGAAAFYAIDQRMAPVLSDSFGNCEKNVSWRG